jgi:outer membrane protein assembly factor BamB
VTRGTTICCSAVALSLAFASAKSSDTLALIPVRQVWALSLNTHIVTQPAFAGTRGFFAVEDNRLAAYDLSSGTRLWLVDARPVFAPVAADDHLVIAEAEALVGLHAEDGSEAWRVALDEPVAARPTAAGHSIVVTTKSGTVHLMRVNDGTIVWSQEVGAPAGASAASDGRHVYVPISDGRIVALSEDTGERVWERRIGGKPGGMLPVGDRLFAGSDDNFFYCLLVKDGQIDWRWRTGGDIVGVPAADSHTVYFASLDNVVRALNQKSGGQRWMRALQLRPTSGPQLAGKTVVIAGPSPAIRTLSAQDGTPTPDIPTGDDVVAAPYTLFAPVTGLPMVVVVTRNIVRADAVLLFVRSIDPIPTPVAPLPDAVMPAPTLPTPP